MMISQEEFNWPYFNDFKIGLILHRSYVIFNIK